MHFCSPLSTLNEQTYSACKNMENSSWKWIKNWAGLWVSFCIVFLLSGGFAEGWRKLPCMNDCTYFTFSRDARLFLRVWWCSCYCVVNKDFEIINDRLGLFPFFPARTTIFFEVALPPKRTTSPRRKLWMKWEKSESKAGVPLNTVWTTNNIVNLMA